jgi:hypothetical protein
MRFDAQASTFEERAGVPPQVCRAVADAVLELGPPPNQHLLELGAGTGAIGAELLRRLPTYIGIDSSQPMLEQFKRRIEPSAWPKLIQADAALPWPVPSSSVGLLLGSRVLHFLPPAHVAAEASRVAGAQGLLLLVGRVRRDPQGARASMRRQMRVFLGEAGISPRDVMLPELMQRLRERGGESLDERPVASWSVTQTPRTALASWSAHDGLAGVTLGQTERERILEQLRRWALSTFGSLDAAVTSEEEYVLSGVRLAAAHSRTQN